MPHDRSSARTPSQRLERQAAESWRIDRRADLIGSAPIDRSIDRLTSPSAGNSRELKKECRADPIDAYSPGVKEARPAHIATDFRQLGAVRASSHVHQRVRVARAFKAS